MTTEERRITKAEISVITINYHLEKEILKERSLILDSCDEDLSHSQIESLNKLDDKLDNIHETYEMIIKSNGYEQFYSVIDTLDVLEE